MSHCGFDLHSLMLGDVEHIFICLLATLSFLGEMSVRHLSTLELACLLSLLEEL